MARENLHSRVVAWLKILLPVAALGILSTLFLISRGNDPVSTIPFAKVDLNQRAKEEGMSNPSFSGATPSGDMVLFSAAIVRPLPKQTGQFLAVDVISRIDLSGGGQIDLTAARALTDSGAVHVTLEDGVVLTSSTGYEIRTDTMIADLGAPSLESGGEITGQGPAGTFSAGKMQLSASGGDGHAQLLFTNGVRLVYRPAVAEE